MFTYVGAKTLAEKAAWDFVETEKPAFRLITLTPPMVCVYVPPGALLRSCIRRSMDPSCSLSIPSNR